MWDNRERCATTQRSSERRSENERLRAKERKRSCAEESVEEE